MSASTPPAVLVFRSAALGDFIIACPALHEVRRSFPGMKLVLLTLQSASKEQRAKVATYAGSTSRLPWVELARPHLVDEVVVVDDLYSLRGLKRTRDELRGLHITKSVVLLEPATPWKGRLKKLLLMTLLTGSIPIGWRGKGWFFRQKAELHARGELAHHVTGAMQFLAELKPPRTVKESEVLFDLRAGPAAQAWAEHWLQAHGLIGKKLVAVAPGSIQPHKRWPIEKFERLCSDLLASDPQIAMVIVGTPADAALGERLARLSPERIITLAGQSSIPQSASLLARCQLVVGNDGGAMHLGDAMGARVVSIVPGLEYPNSVEPWHNRQFAVRHTVACAPCYSFDHCPKGHNQCMNDLPIDAVLEQCMLALQAAETP